MFSVSVGYIGEELAPVNQRLLLQHLARITVKTELYYPPAPPYVHRPRVWSHK